MLHVSAQHEGTCATQSAAWALLMMSWCQEGLSEASDSQDSMQMLKVFKGDLQAVLKTYSLPSYCALAGQSSP